MMTSLHWRTIPHKAVHLEFIRNYGNGLFLIHQYVDIIKKVIEEEIV